MKVDVNGYIVTNDDKEIYDYFGITTTAPQDIANAITQAGGGLVEVEIGTCYGGDIDPASEMYTALRSYAGEVKIYITGLAASAASIIAMARYSEMSPTARMMVHKVSTYAQGNSKAMDQASYVLLQADKSLAVAYEKKSGMSEEEALVMMESETWLTAQEAVDKKLIDKVMFDDSEQLINAYGGSMLPHSVIEKVRNMLHPIPEVPEILADNTAEKNKLMLKIDLI